LSASVVANAQRRALSSGPRKFNVLGIQQIALGALSKQDLSHFWGDLLGLKKVGTYRAEKENVDEDIYVLGGNIV
jgi:lactoylglutathione lyase